MIDNRSMLRRGKSYWCYANTRYKNKEVYMGIMKSRTMRVKINQRSKTGKKEAKMVEDAINLISITTSAVRGRNSELLQSCRVFLKQVTLVDIESVQYAGESIEIGMLAACWRAESMSGIRRIAQVPCGLTTIVIVFEFLWVWRRPRKAGGSDGGAIVLERRVL